MLLDDNSDEPQPPYKLTITEYDEIAQRLEESLKPLDLLKTMLESAENLDALREKVEHECEKMTMRIKFGSKQSERQSTQNTSVITDVYKATLVDIDKQAFVTLKSHKNKR